VAASAESEDAVDGEEFTNKIPQIYGGAAGFRERLESKSQTA
jgi:hypothetical protein